VAYNALAQARSRNVAGSGSFRRLGHDFIGRILKLMPRVNALNNYLRMYRKRAGLTQAELAFLLGCTHRSKVSRYERGVRMPALQTLIGFEVLFRAPVAKLFAGTYAKLREETQNRARRLSKQLDAKPSTRAISEKLDALDDIIHPPKARDAA
jgi:transcriptional regulator with XRE-family HTH domain